MLRTRLSLWMIPGVVWALACGSDSSGPDAQVFAVRSASTTETSVDPDGTIRSTIDLIVEDGTERIQGARLRYTVSAGDLSATTGTSGAAGFASVDWTVTSAQYAGQSTVTFSACAGDQEPPSCTPAVIVTLNVLSP